MGDELWSGWGIRTMSTGDAAYNPLSYHNGTVWPHDTSLGAWGLAPGRPPRRRGADRPHAARGVPLLRLVAARGVRGLRPRTRPRFRSPTRPRRGRRRGRPGTPLLLLRLLLGLEPDPVAGELRSTQTAAPEWLDGLELEGVRAFGRSWQVAVDGDEVLVYAKFRQVLPQPVHG